MRRSDESVSRPPQQVHATSGRSAYGFALVVLACVIWGFFPIAAKSIATQLDPYTLNFYRFSIAGALLLPFLVSRRKLPRLHRARPRVNLRLLICASLLVANYFLYIIGIKHITPSATQILIQLSTVMLLAAGVLLFGERLSLGQWLGSALFVAGLAVFFYPRLLAMFQGLNDYALGMGLIALAATCWTSYAVAQKQLLLHFESAQVMLVIYVLGSLVFLPLSHPLAVLDLSGVSFSVLLFCGASTFVGSGAFAEALAHIEASKASAMFATLPVLTMFFMWVLGFVPGFTVDAEPLTGLTLVGAALVVIGALMVALRENKKVSASSADA